MLKNTGGQVDTQIEDFRTTLLELRKAFLDQATIAIEITAFQILDDMGIISAKVDWISTQLQWVSSHVLDAGRLPRLLAGDQSEDCHRIGRKNQRNPLRDRLTVRTGEGMSSRNAHGILGLHR